MTQTAQRVDPFRVFNFLVELDGIAQASFIECSGLGTTTEVIETREGGDNTTVRKLPGKTTNTDIVLKWGMTSVTELWVWRQQIIDGIVLRKNGSIVVFDLANSTEVARWNFVNAWPSKLEGPAFNAKGNDIAINTLTLSHEGITRVL
jgi:phage tail-like protein